MAREFLIPTHHDLHTKLILRKKYPIAAREEISGQEIITLEEGLETPIKILSSLSWAYEIVFE